MVEVNLAELPLEILERIIAELDPDEIGTSVSKISRRFAEVSYNVLCKKFRDLQAPIHQKLSESKDNLERLSTSPTTFEEEMVQVSNFTFYQILQSEYNILGTIYLNCRSVEYSALVFHGVRSLKEFNKLLFGRTSNFQEDNVSSLLDSLRNCNSEILELFFCKVWNLQKDYMGTLIVRLLDCSLCSTFDLEVTHEQVPKNRNSKCHLSGKYEITDMSNTLSSPPDGLRDMESEKAKKIFVAYICDAIRWGNLFHTLRLRWICMDRALAVGRRHQPGWPRIDPRHPYETTTDEKMTVQESVQSVHNGEFKTIRRLKRASKVAPTAVSSWMGTRIELQLWCRSDEIPDGMLSEEYRTALQNSGDAEGEDDGATWPYHFKLKYHANVRALAGSNQGLVKTTIIIKDTLEQTNIQQIKTIVTA